MKPATSDKGYLTVVLRREGRSKTYRVNRLILEAFIGPAPSSDHEGDHEDFDRSNNSIDNLSWKTRQQNVERIVANGRHNPMQGTKHGMSILTDGQVLTIRHLRSAGRTYQNIADQFGLTKSHVSDVCVRRTWKHI